MKPSWTNTEFFIWGLLFFWSWIPFKRELVKTGYGCLHIREASVWNIFQVILCLTKLSYDKNLLLKGFTCELMLVGHTANVQFQHWQLQANTRDGWAFSLQWMTVGSHNKPSASAETTEERTSLPEHKQALLSGHESWFETFQLKLFHLPPFMVPGPSWHYYRIYQLIKSLAAAAQQWHSANSRLLAFTFCCANFLPRGFGSVTSPIQTSSSQSIERRHQHPRCARAVCITGCIIPLTGLQNEQHRHIARLWSHHGSVLAWRCSCLLPPSYSKTRLGYLSFSWSCVTVSPWSKINLEMIWVKKTSSLTYSQPNNFINISLSCVKYKQPSQAHLWERRQRLRSKKTLEEDGNPPLPKVAPAQTASGWNMQKEGTMLRQ